MGGGPGAIDASVEGTDTAFGYTAGLNWMPTSQTSVGLGYRSAISHKIKGTISEPAASIPALVNGNDVEASVTLPDIATLSIRQKLTDKAKLLGTVEWTHWSDLQQLDVTCPVTGGPFCKSSTHLANSIPFRWHDGWMFALGGEYDFSKQLKLRSGIAYEISPVQNPQDRTSVVPDQNRLWLSGGGTYDLSNMISVDLAYSHIWGLGGDIDRTQPTAAGPIKLLANVSSSADIISGAIKFKLNP